VNGVSPLHLGPISLPLWLVFVVVAASRFALDGLSVKKGVMLMKRKLTILFPFTGSAEMVWDIGTKVVAALVVVSWLDAKMGIQSASVGLYKREQSYVRP